MKKFYLVIANTLIASVTNFFVWFALVFWLYLQTKSVLTTAFTGGAFMIMSSAAGFWLGSIVDHHRKKSAMLLSSTVTLIMFSCALAFYLAVPKEAFTSVQSWQLWALSAFVLIGVCANNIRMIALPTLVTLLIPENERDKANGMSGMVMGFSSSGAGIASGAVLAYLGMKWVLVIGLIFTCIAILHLLWLHIPEEKIVHSEDKPKKVDLKGTMKMIASVHGLFALIFFTTFNNFLGGVFMSLMDPYGLSLVPVQIWSLLWGFLSMGFVLGGLYIAKKGLGPNPLKTMFHVNSFTWFVCIFFTIQPSIILLCLGILLWVVCVPFVEASEQTIIQRVVPLERQGRVFGFAQSIEMSASPLTAFIIGPLAQFFFIPFMSEGGRGAALIGSWFGVGPGRGIALVFTVAGIVGLCVNLIARRSHAYTVLSETFKKNEPVAAVS